MSSVIFNTCKGVIRSWESPSCTDDELNEWFQSHNIQSFYRLSKRKDSESESLVLTFQGTTLPEAATVGFERCRVRPFIPNPRRCFRCQRFGHISKVCSRTEVCAQCGSSDHTHTRDTPCTAEPMCVNCGEQHPAFDRLCPRFKIEKEAHTISTPASISLISISLYPIAFGTVGGNVVRDILSLEGDSKVGYPTLPQKIGSVNAAKIGALFFLLTGLLAPLPSVPFFSGHFSVYYLPLILLWSVLLIYSSIRLMTSSSTIQNIRKYERIVTMSMILLPLALIVEAIIGGLM